MNHCGNCANYVWGDKKTPLPSECFTCTTTHVPNGENPTPSNWRALPKTNADRIRAMSDEELARWISDMWHGFVSKPWCDFRCQNCREGDDYRCEKCALEWLKQPAEVDKDA